MKDKDLDRLFRQKIGDLHQEPTSHAWDQLEKQLQHKRGRKGWVNFSSIAASLLLLLGLWASFEYSTNFLPSDPLAQEKPKELPSEPEQARKDIPQEPSTSVQEDLIAANEPKKEKPSAVNETLKKEDIKEQAKSEKSLKPVLEAQESAEKISVQKPLIKQAIEPERIAAENQVLPSIRIAESVPTESRKDIEEKKERVIIRYNALDQGELTHQDLAQTKEDTAEEEKDVSARKIIGFLKKVKNGNAGNLAELREAKDELLSFRIGKPNTN